MKGIKTRLRGSNERLEAVFKGVAREIWGIWAFNRFWRPLSRYPRLFGG